LSAPTAHHGLAGEQAELRKAATALIPGARQWHSACVHRLQGASASSISSQQSCSDWVRGFRGFAQRKWCSRRELPVLLPSEGMRLNEEVRRGRWFLAGFRPERTDCSCDSGRGYHRRQQMIYRAEHRQPAAQRLSSDEVRVPSPDSQRLRPYIADTDSWTNRWAGPRPLSVRTMRTDSRRELEPRWSSTKCAGPRLLRRQDQPLADANG